MAVDIQGTFQGILAFQHLQTSDKCCKIALAVLLDRLRHHVQYVVRDRRPEFQVVMRLDALLGDCLGDALAVATFELAGEEVSEPSFKKRDNIPRMENSPTRQPGAQKPQSGPF